MKKVLIITYYWPPAGGPGVQRVLKFAKYLPQFGWQPMILTVQDGEYPAYDESLMDDIPPQCKVYHTPSFEPFTLYKKFTGMRVDEAIPVAALTEKRTGWKKKIAHWIRLNLFIPDAKIGWIPFAVKAGQHIIKKEKPDVIFSSSPPPTVHLIAKSLARWSRIKWVADFRDPWTDIYHYDNLKQNKYSRFYNIVLEKKVLNKADILVTVSKGFASLLNIKISNDKKINIISNGYDQEDFLYDKKTQNSDKFIMGYIGKMNSQQNPFNLWLCLKKLMKKNQKFAKNFELLFIGNIDKEILKKIEEIRIESCVNSFNYLNHRMALDKLNKSYILLLLIPDTKNNIGIVPGKLFEYLATNKFVLGIGPKRSDASRILNETKSGKMFEFRETDILAKEIEKQFGFWMNDINHDINRKEIRKYSRRELTKKLVGIFEN